MFFKKSKENTLEEETENKASHVLGRSYVVIHLTQHLAGIDEKVKAVRRA